MTEQEAAALSDQINRMKEKQKRLNAMYDDTVETLTNKLRVGMKTLDKHTLYAPASIAYFRPQTKIEVADWDKVWAYILKTKAIDIIQRRISPAALEKRIDAGEKIDGVTVTEGEVFTVKGLKEGKKDEQES